MSELYKKYRPRSLERVVGNEDTIQSLQKMVQENIVPHAILFAGLPGTGKTTCARILRKALGCHDIDYTELNSSSFRGIDTIREIMRTMNLAPTGGECRVWVLDECHSLSRDAMQASLKMLEDTPSHVYFFLCTTDPGKLLPAIRSRCTEMVLRPLNDDEMSKLILRACKKEGIDISSGTIEDICEASQGLPRKALVILDKIRNLPEEQRSQAAKGAQEEEEKQTIDLCRALIRRENWSKIAAILKAIKGVEPETIRRGVLGYCRSVLLGAKSSKEGIGAYNVLCAFEEPLYNSGDAGLARACFEAIHGD